MLIGIIGFFPEGQGQTAEAAGKDDQKKRGEHHSHTNHEGHHKGFRLFHHHDHVRGKEHRTRDEHSRSHHHGSHKDKGKNADSK